MVVPKPFCLGDRLSPINTNKIQTMEKLSGKSSVDCSLLFFYLEVVLIFLVHKLGSILPLHPLSCFYCPPSVNSAWFIPSSCLYGCSSHNKSSYIPIPLLLSFLLTPPPAPHFISLIALLQAYKPHNSINIVSSCPFLGLLYFTHPVLLSNIVF